MEYGRQNDFGPRAGGKTEQPGSKMTWLRGGGGGCCCGGGDDDDDKSTWQAPLAYLPR